MKNTTQYDTLTDSIIYGTDSLQSHAQFYRLAAACLDQAGESAEVYDALIAKAEECEKQEKRRYGHDFIRTKEAN